MTDPKPAPAPTPGWKSVGITSIGEYAAQGTMLLPVRSESLSRVVVRELGQPNRTKLLAAGIRADGTGDEALMPGELVSSLGGINGVVEYRKATWRDVLRYKPAVRIQILIAFLTLAGTIMSAVTSFVGTRSASTPTFAADAAPAALALATVMASWKLWNDVNGDLK
jgi:hypothetical protein